jgi:hypothetical protein
VPTVVGGLQLSTGSQDSGVSPGAQKNPKLGYAQPPTVWSGAHVVPDKLKGTQQ